MKHVDTKVVGRKQMIYQEGRILTEKHAMGNVHHILRTVDTCGLATIGLRRLNAEQF